MEDKVVPAPTLNINDIMALVEMAAPRGSAEKGVVQRVAEWLENIHRQAAQQAGQPPAPEPAASPNGHEAEKAPVA